MRRMNLLRTVFLYIVALVLFHSIFCMRDISVLSFGVYVVLFSVPVILYSFVCTTTAREYRLRNLQPATLLFKLTKSRVMSYMIAVPVYTVLASVSVMNIYLFSTAEYLSFLIIAVVLCTVNSIAKQSFHKLYKAEYVDYYQQRFQLMVMAVCAAVVYPILCYYIRKTGIIIPFLNRTIDNIQKDNAVAYTIALLLYKYNYVLSQFASLLEQRSSALPVLYIIVFLLLQGGILFYFLMRFFLFFTLPVKAYISVVRPVAAASEYRNDGEKKYRRYFLALLLFLIIAVPVFYGICEVCFVRYEVPDKLMYHAEQIENGLYKYGTKALIDAKANIIAAKTKTELIQKVNAYFDEMNTKVDNYLDWYYGLSAEYGKLLSLLQGVITGSAEEKVSDYLNKNMTEYISPGSDLEQVLSDICDSAAAEFAEAKQTILEENRILRKSDGTYMAVTVFSQDDFALWNIPYRVGFTTVGQRIAVSAAGGIVAGVVISRIAKKGVAKLAQKMLIKSVAQKASAAGVGALLGSIASPVGSVAGFAAGTGFAILFDKIFLELEESVKREQYKQDIIAGIEEERAAILEALSAAGGVG